ncbi:HTH-type transcriptional regulator EthR [Methylobacterium bullatum]|uniref:HTH-type transcriptional regulator EthR n=1 Tax=Methylobacterium bullatum TaxID=570505 RepID=A0A679J8D3_9HYPH|nr:HTH-type transcriptional regulator EthR [Methylobacterium bullatum]
MTSSSLSRMPRKDALQNRAHILDVAGRAIGESGVDVSMDAIAKLAGVGSATLYRHFPTRDALLVALLAPHHERLHRDKAAIEAAGGDSGRMLERWIDALGDWMRAYDGLPEPLRAGWSVTASPFKSTCDGIIESTEGFLRAAQRDGFARPTASATDIFLGSLAVAWASGRSAARTDTRDRLRDLLRNGWSANEAEAAGGSGTAGEHHPAQTGDR